MRTPQIQRTCFTVLTLTAAFAWNNCQGETVYTMAVVPVNANNVLNAKTGPLLPPDPWESPGPSGNVTMTAQTKTGPLLPPDPWESPGPSGNVTIFV